MEEEKCCQEEIDKGLLEFLSSIKKIKETRFHKVKNSYGVYDGYKYYRKTKPKESKYILSESNYFSIIRRVNELLVELLIEGNDITFPMRMGRLELRKYNPKIYIKDGKVKTTLPVDWDRTLKLWYEDEESYKNKTLVKIEEKEIFKVYYNRNIANFVNKSFYKFNLNRDVKRRLKKVIKDNKIDAFMTTNIQ